MLDYGETGDILYMIMPLIAGGTLAELLVLKPDPLPLAEIAGYLNQLASAVEVFSCTNLLRVKSLSKLTRLLP